MSKYIRKKIAATTGSTLSMKCSNESSKGGEEDLVGNVFFSCLDQKFDSSNIPEDVIITNLSRFSSCCFSIVTGTNYSINTSIESPVFTGLFSSVDV